MKTISSVITIRTLSVMNLLHPFLIFPPLTDCDDTSLFARFLCDYGASFNLQIHQSLKLAFSLCLSRNMVYNSRVLNMGLWDVRRAVRISGRNRRRTMGCDTSRERRSRVKPLGKGLETEPVGDSMKYRGSNLC
jgi:hypothetical protein